MNARWSLPQTSGCCCCCICSCGCTVCGSWRPPPKMDEMPAPSVWPMVEPTATPAAVEAMLANMEGCCGACWTGAGAAAAWWAGVEREGRAGAERRCERAIVTAGKGFHPVPPSNSKHSDSLAAMQDYSCTESGQLGTQSTGGRRVPCSSRLKWLV